MAKKEWSSDEILKELRAKVYHPIYYLMGEEPYFIDKISDYITGNILTDEEKEFNLTILYGSETDVPTVINAAKRFPMMSAHQVVVVREAQSLNRIDELAYYVQKPLMSTILVLCHKHGKLDKRYKLAAEIEKTGVLFESKKIKDSHVPGFISTLLKQKGVGIEPKAAEMLTEFVGADLSRLEGELEKLVITLPKGSTRILPESVEKNIGISKDYNNFELRYAIVAKDVFKANRIIKYFSENPKNNPIQATLAVLFNFFSNLMLAYYAPVKNEQGVASMLGLRNTWQAREYLEAMQKYNGVKTMQIIGAIRYADAKSKGVNNPSLSDNDILRELIFYILH